MNRDAALTSVFRNATSSHLATTPRGGRREDVQTPSKPQTLGNRAYEVLQPSSTERLTRFVDGSSPRQQLAYPNPKPQKSEEGLMALRAARLEEEMKAEKARAALRRAEEETEALRAQAAKILAQDERDAALWRKAAEEEFKIVRESLGETAKDIEFATKQARERRQAALAEAATAEARRDALISEAESVATSLDETRKAFEAAKLMLRQMDTCVDVRRKSDAVEDAFETEVVSLEDERRDEEYEKRFLFADRVAAEAVASLALMSNANDDATVEETLVYPLSNPRESENYKSQCDTVLLEKKLLVADNVAAEAVAAAALSAMRDAESTTAFYSLAKGGLTENKSVSTESDRGRFEAVAAPASLAIQHDNIALVERLRQREIEYPIAKKTAYATIAGPHVSRLAARNRIVVESGDFAENGGDRSWMNANPSIDKNIAEGTDEINSSKSDLTRTDAVSATSQAHEREPKKNLLRCRRVIRTCRGCFVGTIYGILRVYSRSKHQIRKQCLRRRREPLSRGVSLLLGEQIEDQYRLDGLRFLVPPHPCGDIPEAERLGLDLQVRLVIVMWIHALGAALIGSVGGIAFAAGLTWRPELGSALSAPLSLATLTVLKAGTSMILFAALFQKARIPPSLAALGCGPLPLDMEKGPLPFRELSSQLLKRLMTSKIIDFAFGMILFAALRTAFHRANQRNRGDGVRALLSLTALGLTVVDIFGALHVWGICVRYVYFLSKHTDDDAGPETDETGIGLVDEEKDDESMLHDDTSRRSSNFSVGPSMRWSDPSYAREIETAALLSSQRDAYLKGHADFV